MASKLGNKTLIMDWDGLTALHLASMAGATHICQYLIVELNFDVNVKDDQGDTPLHHATLGEHFDTADYLLEKGANPNAANSRRLIALHYAADKGLEQLISLLISKGAVVDTQAFSGTPLQHAATRGKKEAMRILLEHSANPNVADHMLSPLLISIYVSSLECVELLLQKGADPNISSCEGMPLVAAAFLGHTDIIKCLIKHKANPNVTHCIGLTPVEVAAYQCNHDSVEVLFPVTSRIPTILDWSVSGIINHVNSDDYKIQCMIRTEEFFSLLKKNGDGAFKRQDYVTAKFWYSMEIGDNPCNATALSNRSLCCARLNEGTEALSDAQACIKLRSKWPKAYYREGVAWSLLKQFGKAADSFLNGLKLDPENEELQIAFREAVLKAM